MLLRYLGLLFTRIQLTPVQLPQGEVLDWSVIVMNKKFCNFPLKQVLG
jgi:hypothetical protein